MDRSQLPQWPRLMNEEIASRYLSIGHNLLREKGPAPVRLGHRVLWDRRDLDRWADELAGQPLDVTTLDQTQRKVERQFFDAMDRDRAKAKRPR